MSQFLNGRRRDSSRGTAADVIDPSSGTLVATITLAGPDDVDEAVQAAKSAYPGWSRATPGERSGALGRFARLLEARAEEMAQLESSQAGKPIRLAREFDVPGTINGVDFFSGAARNLEAGPPRSTPQATPPASGGNRSASSEHCQEDQDLWPSHGVPQHEKAARRDHPEARASAGGPGTRSERGR